MAKTQSITRSNFIRGQGLVEFALALPLLLLVILGIVDFGRLFLMYSAVSNAAREGVRYGAVSGVGADIPYLDCAGIRDAAKRTAASGLVTLNDADITSQYDRGQTSDVIGQCGSVTASQIQLGHRLVVTVNTTFRPLTPIVGNLIPPIPVTFQAARTILKGGAASGPTITSPPSSTSVATNTPGPTQPAATSTTVGAPQPPTGFDATISCGPGADAVSATWVASPSPGITEYRIYRAVPGPTTLVAVSNTTAKNNFENLLDGTVGVYYVVAVNATAESAPSNTDSVVCGSTNTPTATSPPTATPTATTNCTIAAGDIATNNPSKWAKVDITNNSGNQIQISTIEATWPESPNDKLKEILFGGQQIFDTLDDFSTTSIPAELAWKSGSDSYRLLDNGATKTLEFIFDGGANPNGYTLYVQFTNGCSVLRSK